ncbi:anthrone oxygenase family protein [Nonomuraea sp. NPDC046570]|uniref:anthrone oxygenase family protein n=1 Tax=Nonomuraea sp. NPDC046570 TaxID=3155255 RepID=UPI0033DC6051
MDALTLAAAALALVTHAALTGLFYSFSMSVMPGLDAVEPGQAETAMRSINVKILNPWLYLAFLGAPIMSAATGALLLASGDTTAALLLFAATAVNFLGSVVVTATVNVPMNNALNAGKLSWAAYSPRWTRWNTARAVCCALGVLLVGAGLVAW